MSWRRIGPLFIAALAVLVCHKPLSAPEPVTLVSPADSAMFRVSSVILSWQAAGVAQSEVQVGTDSRFRALLTDDTLATDSDTLEGLVDGHYYWRVRAQSAEGAWSDWSETRRFDVERFRVVASVKTQGYPHDVFVRGSRAYVADGQAGLAVFDISNPEAPQFLGSKMDSLNEAWGVTADDSFAYVAYGYKELVIVDVRRTDSLSITGVLEYLQPGYGYDIALQDSFVYVAADAQFVKINVANRRAPGLVFQGYYPRDCRGVALQGGHAYLACGQLGTALWRTDTAPAYQVGGMDTPGNARGVAVSGGYEYIADGREGLMIVDVSDPARPSTVGSLALSGYALTVAVQDSIVCVACGDGGISVVNAAQPANPRLVARVDTPHCVGVFIAGGYVFGGDRDLGLVVIKQEE